MVLLIGWICFFFSVCQERWIDRAFAVLQLEEKKLLIPNGVVEEQVVLVIVGEVDQLHSKLLVNFI